MYMYMYMCICTYMYACVCARGQPQASFLRNPHLSFDSGSLIGLQIAKLSKMDVYWTIKITNMHRHIWFLCMGSVDQLNAFTTANTLLSHLPSPPYPWLSTWPSTASLQMDLLMYTLALLQTIWFDMLRTFSFPSIHSFFWCFIPKWSQTPIYSSP